MDLRKLSYFIRISEDGSLTRAAGVLRVAQPALSRQLKLLEKDLDTTLFNRTKRGMTLTQEGDFLYNSIVGPLRDLDKALVNFRSFSSGIDGTLSIGIPPEVGLLIAPRLIESMKSVLPSVKPRIVEGYSGNLRDLVTRGILDFAIVEGSWNRGALPSFEVFTDTLILVGPETAQLTIDHPMVFREVARLPLIVPCQPSGVRSILNEAALEAKVTINVAFEIDSPAISLKMVQENGHYTVMPKSYLSESRNHNISYTDIQSPELKMGLFLTSRGHWSEYKNGPRSLDQIMVNLIKSLLFNNK